MRFKTLFFALAFSACAKSVPPPRHVEPAPEPVTEAVASKPERDDGMQLEGQLGSIPAEDIDRVFREKWTSIARCSQLAQTRLAYLHGTIELKVRVGKDGSTVKAYVERSSLGNWDAERCVLDVTRAMVFPAPQGGSEAELTFPIEIQPKRGNVVAWEAARIAPTAQRSKLDAGVCRGDAPATKGAKKHNATVAPPKDVPPNLSLTLYIAPGGKVSSMGLAGEGPIDEQFASCLIARARTWRVDDPRGRVAKATFGIE